MKYVNVRQLLNNYKEATSVLPVMVTRNGIPIFKIISAEDFLYDTPEKISKNFEPQEFQQDAPITLVQTEGPRGFEPREETVPTGRCEVQGCQEDATTMGKIWFEGDEVEVPMCKKHAFKSLKEV